MKQHNFDYIDIDEYARKANSYIMFHDIVKKYRKWYSPTNKPYNRPEIFNALPSSIIDYPFSIPQHLEDLFVTCLN